MHNELQHSEEGTHTTDYEGKDYDVYALIRESQSLVAEQLPLEAFEHTYDQICWDDGTGTQPKPKDLIDLAAQCNGDWEEMVRRRPDWTEHIQQTRAADYQNHPILVIKQKDLLDGMHRLTRARIDKAQSISVKNFVKLPQSAELKDSSQ